MGETVVSIDISTLLVFIFGGVNLIVLGPIAWILKGALADIKTQGMAHAALKDKVQTEYIHKEHYGRDIREIKDMLGTIYQKLDGKADKA